MQQRQIVARPHVGQVGREVVVDEVGDQEDDEAPAAPLDSVDGGPRIGLDDAAGPGAGRLEQGAQEAEELASPRPGRLARQHPVGEKDPAQAVAALDRRGGQRRAELDRQLELGLLPQTGVHRGTEVDRQVDLALALLEVHPHVRLADPRRDRPVDPAGGLARNVLARLVEQQAPAGDRRCPVAADEPARVAPGDELEQPDAAQQLGGVPGVRARGHRCQG